MFVSCRTTGRLEDGGRAVSIEESSFDTPMDDDGRGDSTEVCSWDTRLEENGGARSLEEYLVVASKDDSWKYGFTMMIFDLVQCVWIWYTDDTMVQNPSIKQPRKIFPRIESQLTTLLPPSRFATHRSARRSNHTPTILMLHFDNPMKGSAKHKSSKHAYFPWAKISMQSMNVQPTKTREGQLGLSQNFLLRNRHVGACHESWWYIYTSA